MSQYPADEDKRVGNDIDPAQIVEHRRDERPHDAPLDHASKRTGVKDVRKSDASDASRKK